MSFYNLHLLKTSVTFGYCGRRESCRTACIQTCLRAICCLALSIYISGCTPAFLQRQAEPSSENKVNRKSELVKPKMAEVRENEAAEARSGNPGTSEDRKSSSPRISENPSSQADTRNELAQGKQERPQSLDAKSNSGLSSEKKEVSDPARRIVARAETSTAASDVDNTGEAKANEPFKRHDHTKYLEIIKNKAVDLVNSDQESTYAAICKDMITDQWSLAFYYTQEKTYKYVTYIWDEIDEKWQKSFVSDKRPISGMEKHLKYSSSGKDCKVLKKTRR